GPLVFFFVYVDAAPLRAGRPADLWVFAVDAYGHLATGYTGTVAFVSTDPAARLPAPRTFALGGYAHVPGGVTFAAPGGSDVGAEVPASFALGFVSVSVSA